MQNEQSNTLIIDTESDPGSWKEALKYSQHIKVMNGNENENESQTDI